MKKRYHFKLWKIKQTWSPLEEDLSLLLSWHAMLSSNSSFARALFEGPRMRTKDWSASCFRPRWINQYGDYRKATNIPKRQVLQCDFINFYKFVRPTWGTKKDPKNPRNTGMEQHSIAIRPLRNVNATNTDKIPNEVVKSVRPKETKLKSCLLQNFPWKEISPRMICLIYVKFTSIREN